MSFYRASIFDLPKTSRFLEHINKKGIMCDLWLSSSKGYKINPYVNIDIINHLYLDYSKIDFIKQYKQINMNYKFVGGLANYNFTTKTALKDKDVFIIIGNKKYPWINDMITNLPNTIDDKSLLNFYKQLYSKCK